MARSRARLLLPAALLMVSPGCGTGNSGATPTDAPGATTRIETTGAPSTAVGAATQTTAAGVDRSGELVARWVVTDYALPSGSLTNVVGDEPVFIEFKTDGTLAYHTGCNAGGTLWLASGTYAVPDSALDETPEGQEISINSQFEQEQQGCEGFLGDQDRDLPANMARATRFVLDGDVLRLLDEFLLIEAERAG